MEITNPETQTNQMNPVSSSKQDTGNSTSNAIEPMQNLSPVKITPLMKISLVILIVLILLLIATSLFLAPRGQVGVKPSSPPEATMSASLVPRAQSEFSKTETFIGFENNVNGLLNDSRTVDLSESALAYPLLEMNVNYQK